MNSKVAAATEVTWQCRKTSLEKGSQTYGGLLGANTSWESGEGMAQNLRKLPLTWAELPPN